MVMNTLHQGLNHIVLRKTHLMLMLHFCMFFVFDAIYKFIIVMFVCLRRFFLPVTYVR